MNNMDSTINNETVEQDATYGTKDLYLASTAQVRSGPA